jgi:hypothetical protein
MCVPQIEKHGVAGHMFVWQGVSQCNVDVHLEEKTLISEKPLRWWRRGVLAISRLDWCIVDQVVDWLVEIRRGKQQTSDAWRLYSSRDMNYSLGLMSTILDQWFRLDGNGTCERASRSMSAMQQMQPVGSWGALMLDVMFSHSAVHRGKQLAVFDTIHHLWFSVARWKQRCSERSK